MVLHSLLERVARRRFAAVMGIINSTPNSFFDGGRYQTRCEAEARVEQALRQGAEIVDIGGESSKPGALAVPSAVQIDRISPALSRARSLGALISVDTASAEVAEFALTHGASIVNDVTCLADKQLAETVARHEGHLLLSHSRVHQSKMPGFSQWPDDAYQDVVAEVLKDLNDARESAVNLGVRQESILFDPGLGFSKNAKHCFELLARAAELVTDGTPWVFGTGRKSFLSHRDNTDAAQRLGGTIASSLRASHSGVQILRAHDVQELVQALAIDAHLDSLHKTTRPAAC